MIIEEYELKIKQLNIKITSFTGDWDTLHSTYLSLLEDLKIQISKNEKLLLIIVDLEAQIEQYNRTQVGGDIQLKQQLELLQRLSIEKKSLNYHSYKEEVRATQSELSGLKMKIERLQSKTFNKSAVVQSISINEHDESNRKRFYEYGHMNNSLDMSHMNNRSSTNGNGYYLK